jgi:hypothetical protein
MLDDAKLEIRGGSVIQDYYFQGQNDHVLTDIYLSIVQCDAGALSFWEA